MILPHAIRANIHIVKQGDNTDMNRSTAGYKCTEVMSCMIKTKNKTCSQTLELHNQLSHTAKSQDGDTICTARNPSQCGEALLVIMICCPVTTFSKFSQKGQFITYDFSLKPICSLVKGCQLQIKCLFSLILQIQSKIFMANRPIVHISQRTNSQTASESQNFQYLLHPKQTFA